MKVILIALVGCLLVPPEIRAQKFSTETRGAISRRTSSSLSKEPDAFYLEDILPKPMKLKVKTEAVVYNNLSAERRLGVISAGTIVSVVAINEKAIRVRGKAQHAEVSGWVGKSHLQEIDPKVLETLNKMHVRHKLVEALIAKKLVAIGMTSQEVERVLGAPTKRTNRTTKAGQTETLEYISCKLVTHRVPTRDAQTGQTFYTPVTTKVETGRTTLTMEGNVVTSIEETQDHSAPLRTVPLPIEIDRLAQ